MKAIAKRSRAISPLIATIILIAITVVGGLLVYSIFTSTSNTMSAKALVSVETADLVKGAGEQQTVQHSRQEHREQTDQPFNNNPCL
jgi:flagellin-like protein